MPGLNPYIQAQQSRRMGFPSAYQGNPMMGAYGGGYGGYGRMANTEGAVTGPVGSSSGSNPQAYEQGRQQMEAQQERQQATNADMGSFRQGQTNQAAVTQAADVANYRAVRDNGVGRDNENTSAAQRTQATDLGIDPSSDAATIAGAASGKTGFDANGMPTGAGTSQQVQPNSTDVATAAAAAQARKTGAQVATTNQAYIEGANARGQAATGAAPFTQGIAPKATPNLTTRPMPGVAAQPATQPVQQPPAVSAPPVRPPMAMPPVGPFPGAIRGDRTNTSRFGPVLSGGTLHPVMQSVYPNGPGTVGTNTLAPNNLQGQYKIRQRRQPMTQPTT